MHLNAFIIIAISVTTGQRPLEYMRNSNNVTTADLLPMISYILSRVGTVKYDVLKCLIPGSTITLGFPFTNY